ncbi:MAG: sulfotransferase [Hyphomonadaceae bacterium]
MSDTEETGPVSVALAHGWSLVNDQPELAHEQAGEILKVAPGNRDARLLEAAAFRQLGNLEQSRAAFATLEREGRLWPRAMFELGLLRYRESRLDDAISLIGSALRNGLKLPNAWRLLGDIATTANDAQTADDAYNRHVADSARDPALLEAALALVDGRLAVAEHGLRDYLKRHPTDVMAIRMLAEVGARLGRYPDAEALLVRALELAPGFAAARHNLAIIRMRLNKPEAVVQDMEVLLAKDPHNPNYRALRCAALVRLGEYEIAIAAYHSLLAEYPIRPKVWMSLGHVLKTVGQSAGSIGAYRKSIALKPELGEAWWSLANLKTFRFSPDDVNMMRNALQQPDLVPEDEIHLHFALGKALEDAGAYEESFKHYDRGNQMGEGRVDYDDEDTARLVVESSRVYTSALFASRTGQGFQAPDPIFIVGMPRAGSTLIEQILASHSLVEGTMELPDMPVIARRLGGRPGTDAGSRYPAIVPDLTPDQLRELGEEYLSRTRIQRKTDKPFFIDKMPNNFAHAGLIRLILPNAKIIDARRHPLACCFSGFKQHFAQGQNFSYGLRRIGGYYRDYVKLMAHLDQVCPGAVHRVIYERMVDDTEAEVGALLAYCGLDFEPACLAFHETQRPVRTASSEQVRQPIFRDGIDQWRNYEPWLGPLKEALGGVLFAYPDVP